MTEPERRPSRHAAMRLAAVLIVALAVRLVAALWWQARLDDRLFGFPDSESYWTLAQQIVRGGPYQFGKARAFRTPGYPVLLALPMAGFGNGLAGVWAARCEAVLLGVAAVGGVWWWARMLFDDGVADLAALLAAVYPGTVATSVFVLSEAPFCPLMIWQLALWTKAERAATTGGRWGWGLAAGVLGGLATLMRPSWLLFIPFAAALALFRPTAWRCHVAVVAASFMGIVVVMSPWWIRNAAIYGRFVPTTLQVGASLYDGLHPGATGASDMRFVADFDHRERAHPSDDPALPFEYRLDRRLRTAAIDWARAHPPEVARLAAIKLARLWNIWPNEPQFSSGWLRLAVLSTYGPLMLAALVGVARYGKRGWPFALAYLPAVYFTLLHVVFVSSLRYREPAMLALTVFAAAVVRDLIVNRVISWWRRP